MLNSQICKNYSVSSENQPEGEEEDKNANEINLDSDDDIDALVQSNNNEVKKMAFTVVVNSDEKDQINSN